MKIGRISGLLVMCGAGLMTSRSASARDLSFEERVSAQQSIERFYYAHQIGTTRPFHEALPQALLEEKVRTYLRESLALQRLWSVPVTAEMLDAEIGRMISGSRMPERLAALFAALGGDPFLVRECLARPALVSRLARNFFVTDQRIHAETRLAAKALREDLANGLLDYRSERHDRTVIHVSGSEEVVRWRGVTAQRVGEIGPLIEESDAFVIRVLLDRQVDGFTIATYTRPKRTWDDWWPRIAGSFDESAVWAVGSSEPLPPLPSGSAGAAPDLTSGLLSSAAPFSAVTCANDTWDNGSLGIVPDTRTDHTTVWTGSIMIVWGGNDGSALDTGGRYEPATDTWTPTSTINALSGRSMHTAIWTGSVMVAWGGKDSQGVVLNSGSRYDPAIDAWTPMSTVGAPTGRSGQTAVWTGSQMIVWGGSGTGQELGTGGIYDPGKDIWKATSLIGAPSPRQGHSAIWTGPSNLMIVWGGTGAGQDLATGGAYDPTIDRWRTTSLLGAPTPRHEHTAIWADTLGQMVGWGGASSGPVYLATGASYDPSADHWKPTSTAGAPPGRAGHTSIWTGSQMIVWGGMSGSPLNSGGRYDPAVDLWTATTNTNAPTARAGHTAIWTGALMVVWGGTAGGSVFFNTGGRYSLSSDSWTPTSRANAPSPRSDHTAVWTGNLMVIWGGFGGSSNLSTGGRYDPATDTWMSTPTTGAPSGRRSHSAAWTGSAMVVWGGTTGAAALNTGARYDPITDAWTPTSVLSSPAARSGHTAVWTGSSMVVWGGTTGAAALNTGARYDPITDAWTPTSVLSSPAARSGHTAVWTGSSMVVWGGTTGVTVLSTGGRYDPVGDIWIPTSMLNAPSARFSHSAILAGKQMIIWGGSDGTTSLNTGGRYDAAGDSWLPTATLNVPSARCSHSAVWTGEQMIVWGGSDSNTGGRYDVATDSWSTTSTAEAPLRRGAHTAVWTGAQMMPWGGMSGASYLNSGGRYCACPGTILSYFLDSDADGFGNTGVSVQSCSPPAGYVTTAGDCNDQNPSVWATPGEVAGLLLNDANTLSWTPPTQPGAVADVFDALRSTNAADFVGAAICIASGISSTTTTDAELPAPGTAFYYLVRAEDACPHGQGTLGTDSRGVQRAGRSCP